MGVAPIIELRDLARSYRQGSWALDGIGLSVRTGEVVGLLGRNGAGKTTLLRCVMGMIRPQRGSVRVLGLDPWQDAVAMKKRIGFVSASQVFPRFLTVAEIIAIHRGLFPSWDSSFERRLADRFEIDHTRKIGTLSTGQARQVALLCAVAHRPELLILDEPDGGLDPTIRREFLETAIELLVEEGSTVIFSSHHMADVERMSERAVLIDQGKVLLDRSIDSLRESCCLAVVGADGAELPTELRDNEACLRIRQRNGTTRLLLDLPPDAARDLLGAHLDPGKIRIESLSLEDLFIELVGRS